MASKGSIAKERVIKKIKEAFGDDFIGIYDGKIYLWEEDMSERVQISVALTCPKIYRGLEEEETGGMSGFAGKPFEPAKVTPEEQETLAQLLNKLGL